MKALIVSTNRERSPFPVAPLGVCFLAAAVRAAGHSVDVVDLTFSRSPRRALAAAFKGKSYDVIGLSIRNLDNCFYTHPVSYVDGVLRIADEVRHYSEAPLVLGGSGFSVSPRGWMERLDATCGVIGEGEHAFVAVLERLAAGKLTDDVPGVLCRDEKNGNAVPASTLDVSALPSPAHELCDYRRYLSRGGFVGIQTKRGCPYRCIYCTYALLEGSEWRPRPPEMVVDEIESVYRSGAGPDKFYFVDSVFNVPREHALAICHELTRRRLSIRWTAYCNPTGFDTAFARAMTAAGCVGVEFGFDAVTEKMLAALGKPFTQADIRAALQAAAEAELPCALHLLFGGPGDTVKDIREAQEFVDSCPTPNAVLASLGIRIYPGTPIAELALREGTLKEGADLFEPVYYVSEGLGESPMQALDAVARQRPEWTTATDWLRPIVRLMQHVANRSGAFPQWLGVRNYGKYMRW